MIFVNAPRAKTTDTAKAITKTLGRAFIKSCKDVRFIFLSSTFALQRYKAANRYISLSVDQLSLIRSSTVTFFFGVGTGVLAGVGAVFFAFSAAVFNWGCRFFSIAAAVSSPAGLAELVVAGSAVCT